MKLSNDTHIKISDDANDTRIKSNDSTHAKSSGSTTLTMKKERLQIKITYNVILEALVSCKSNTPLSEDLCAVIRNKSNYPYKPEDKSNSCDAKK